MNMPWTVWPAHPAGSVSGPPPFPLNPAFPLSLFHLSAAVALSVFDRTLAI